MDGPSRANVVIKDLSDGNCRVEYSVTEPGLYTVDVKFDDAHITGSPFKVFIAPHANGQDGKRHSSAFQTNTTIQESKSSEWNNAPSENEAPINYPASDVRSSKTDKTLRQVEIVERNNNSPVDHSSPQQQQQHQKLLNGDARKVSVSGSGLDSFTPGSTSSFHIDSSKAGPNLLFVGVVTSKGPSDEVLVKHEGSGVYKVSYKIDERSKALIFVKYGDQQIPGSPFGVRPT
jgi:filamin